MRSGPPSSNSPNHKAGHKRCLNRSGGFQPPRLFLGNSRWLEATTTAQIPRRNRVRNAGLQRGVYCPRPEAATSQTTRPALSFVLSDAESTRSTE